MYVTLECIANILELIKYIILTYKLSYYLFVSISCYLFCNIYKWSNIVTFNGWEKWHQFKRAKPRATKTFWKRETCLFLMSDHHQVSRRWNYPLVQDKSHDWNLGKIDHSLYRNYLWVAHAKRHHFIWPEVTHHVNIINTFFYSPRDSHIKL